MPTLLPAILGGTPVRPEGPPGWPPDDPALAAALHAALADGSWGRYHGPHGERLRQRLSDRLGCGHVMLCSSGTAAVELALRGLKVGPGDEVVLAAYDFEGNFKDVLVVGATPVLVDVRPDNWNLDADRFEAALSDRTRAVIVSHLHGGIVDVPRVVELARAHGVAVIEDACQVPGAIIHGREAGTWGDVGAWSFGGSKLLSAGRGGAVFTHDAAVAQRIALYTQRGNDAYPLSELQAAVLLPQLERLDERNRTRAANADRLKTLLTGRPGLTSFRSPEVSRLSAVHEERPPIEGSGTSIEHPTFNGQRSTSDDGSQNATDPVYYKLGLQYDPVAFDRLSREAFAAAMRAEGIAIDAGFRSLHRTHSRRRFRSAGALPNADAADAGVLVLHHPVLLKSGCEIAQIAEALDKLRSSATILRERLDAGGT